MEHYIIFVTNEVQTEIAFVFSAIMVIAFVFGFFPA